MKSVLSLILFVNFVILHLSCQTRPFVFKKLLCEYTSQANQVQSAHPRFSWIIESSERGQKQTAYQILVSASQEKLEQNIGELWDSGKQNSAETAHIRYAGDPLQSNSRYFWKVKVWDQNQKMVTSAPSAFHTALLDSGDWIAQWIGTGPVQEPRSPAGFFKHVKEEAALADTVTHNGRSDLLRHEFTCAEKIENARVYVTGLGYYELYLNGQKIGDRVLAPAKTHYRKQVLYDSYDVTEALNKGRNAVGIHLGNGWFNPYKKWWRPYRMQWFGAKRALFQLHVTYQSGETAIFTSNDQWKSAPGPVIFNCIYDGEIYDATQEYTAWSEPGFNDNDWQPVNRVEAPGGKLVSHQMAAIKVTREIEPVKTIEPQPGVRIFDLGQNFAGWVRITVKGRRGTKLHLRFAEDLNDDGTLNPASNERARASATYILKGGASETYEPRFTFFGFKYVEVTGEPRLPEIEQLTGCVVHSACELTGDFSCGNELINKIHRATVWSQRSNMLGYPLDCPQRDERLGWFGDAQVTAEEAMFNFDIPLFYQNWLSGIRVNQDSTGDIPIISPRPYIWDEGVEWSSTYIILTWRHYLHYGDPQILSEHYATMKRYLQFLDSIATNLLLKKGWIGDWGSLVEGWQEGEPESVPTAFYFYNAVILSKIARILDRPADAAHFSQLAERIRQAYHQAYFNPATNDYNDGSQMANAFPLFLGIVPDELREAVLANLVHDILAENDGHLTTGVLGSKYMIDALTQAGRPDVAYGLATQTGYPSWSDMVEKYTTLCEFWTLKQSHNHVMLGSIDAFFYNTLAGIQADEMHPGFKKFSIKTYVPNALSHVKASIETIRGEIVSRWKKTDTEFRLKVKIPFNTTAEIYLPTNDTAKVYENGKLAGKNEGVTFKRIHDRWLIYTVGAGKYDFKVEAGR